MANTVYRGSSDRQPKTISDRTVSGALLPCTFVFIGATQFTQAASVIGGRLALLSNRDFYSPMGSAFDNSDPLTTAYTSGETGIAYELEPAQVYQVAAAAGTYTNGQEVTVGASGRFAAASAGATVVGHIDLPAGTASIVASAGQLVDVVIANRYTKAA